MSDGSVTRSESWADALVGYTGFVGGNVSRTHTFTDLYNSANIAQIAGRSYDLVVFSAARAEKWRINQNPEADTTHIDELKETLASFRTNQLVLISTVDVYGHPISVDENTPVPEPGLHPYGAHRAELEDFARHQFTNVLVVRLPALFGPGIKKNVVFDLLNNNGVEKIDHRGSFQYYDLRHLWDDVTVALRAGLELVNFATQPISTGVVAREAFGMDFTNEPEGSRPASYDVRSIHAELFGGGDGYLYTATQVLDDLRAFVAAERSGAWR
jgi:nucleoside-diphosphate-sugar epimerase